jgi:glucose-6-phosphate dehydrogenase assembly protein OpcA
MIEQDIRVHAGSIEKQLAELWRAEKQAKDGAITRAALWNVVAHAWTPKQHAHAAEVLASASASVPQRTIIVRADPDGPDDMQAWISANCHILGDSRQVCSEEVSIVAGGERVDHIAPLVNALLLPDMPVAVWWLGDLPNEHAYVEALLEPADRLIVDSSHFDSAADFELVAKIAAQTTTAPADVNWARVEEWRAASAAVFDPPAMRERLPSIANVRVTTAGGSLGAMSEAVLYVSWLMAQVGYEIPFELATQSEEEGISAVDIRFHDNTSALIRGDRGRGVVQCSAAHAETELDCITRKRGRGLSDLIVRLLKQPESDRIYLKTLRIARGVAARVAASHAA